MTFSAHLFLSENICKQCKELPTDVQLQISLETYHSSINCKQAKKVFLYALTHWRREIEQAERGY